MKTLQEQQEFINNLYPNEAEDIYNIAEVYTLLCNMDDGEYREIVGRSEQEGEC